MAVLGEAAEGEIETAVAAAAVAEVVPSAAADPLEASLPLLSQMDIPELSQRFPGFDLAAAASATIASGGGFIPS